MNEQTHRFIGGERVRSLVRRRPDRMQDCPMYPGDQGEVQCVLPLGGLEVRMDYGGRIVVLSPDEVEVVNKQGDGHVHGSWDAGGFCNELVMRDGYGETCGYREPFENTHVLGELIWNTNRDDEGTISYAGANIVAKAVLSYFRPEVTRLREENARLKAEVEAIEVDLPNAIKGRLSEQVDGDCTICPHGQYGQMDQMLSDEMDRAEKAEAELEAVREIFTHALRRLSTTDLFRLAKVPYEELREQATQALRYPRVWEGDQA